MPTGACPTLRQSIGLLPRPVHAIWFVKLTRKKTLIAIAAILAVAGGLFYRSRSDSQASSTTAPNNINVTGGDSNTRQASMADVLELARQARQQMSTSLNDYSARFVKQETDTSGVLTEESEILMKVQTRLRNETDDAPMRVYLKFTRPDSVNGREVIWGEDIYDGNMQVKEAGLLGLMTISLDPNGMIAMRGQRYPISEIGMVRLVEKLIERGERDVDSPDISVTITGDYRVGDVPAELIQVRRSKPAGGEDDFALAEIAYDPDRQLILSYRSFGWPQEGEHVASDDIGQLPLQESYTYHDIKTNVGLTDSDFDTSNPEYSFP